MVNRYLRPAKELEYTDLTFRLQGAGIPAEHLERPGSNHGRASGLRRQKTTLYSRNRLAHPCYVTNSDEIANRESERNVVDSKRKLYDLDRSLRRGNQRGYE